MTTKLPYIETSQLRAALTLLKMSDDVRLVTNCVHINVEHIEVSNGHVVLRMKHNSEFSDDIVIQFDEAIPSDAEYTHIKSYDDGSYVAIHYKQEKDENFYPYYKTKLTLIKDKYPSFNRLFEQEFIKGEAPLLQSMYLALPYLLFGRVITGMLKTKDSKSVLFDFSLLTKKSFGDPKLLVLAVADNAFDIADKVYSLIKDDD
ncbi:hypothetical protein ACBQ20_03330 [Proteus vulgaris]|uniref:hypothetical protein n=1 Tax=Proteus TaxID=583 RepID=UPI0014133F72|nr:MULTISPECIES: hypothetical protein [Proteus]MBG3090747.1 hypothetical protein [Proteus terrae subsp. cibarius]MCE9840646.1 hypothetical protein [Proteus terrae]MCO8051861.1 hypothetical protein [Proteus penneri]NBM54538.1 hypothetical protein [Proteus sp. G2669]